MIITGKVGRGQSRGKTLGFPTANIPLSEKLPEGIYVSYITVDGEKYEALTFVGTAKTFNETTYQSETYILDFDGDLYDKELEIELLEKIRENQKFESEEALVEQMKRDTMTARAFFKTDADSKSRV